MSVYDKKLDGLSRIGQGGMGIGGESTRDITLASAHIAGIRLGIESGLTLVDTAEVYADGLSEELIGEAIQSCRSEVFVASKFSPENSSYSRVIAAAERSLKRLKTEYLDLYQIHWPNPEVPISETMRALDKLVGDGKVLNIGVSNFSGREFREASQVARTKIFSNQVEYSLFDRFAEEDALPTSREHSALLFAYSPLNKGRNTFTGQAASTLRSIADRHSASIHQIQLSWLAHQPAVVPIPKSTNPERIKQNGAAIDIQLSANELEEISAFCSIPKREIAPSEISVSTGGFGNRPVYRTLSEALENRLGLAPSPSELAKFLLEGDPVKPVRVVPSYPTSRGRPFELTEGRLRYWAWIIAFGEEIPIPALINEAS